jgi:predicted N-acetyltransferase YhbS
VISSDTSVRGKGYGQALMQSRLDRVDAEHAPAYLESSKAENVPYYQRFGFEVTGEITCPMAARRCGRCGGRRAEYGSRTQLCDGG